MVAGASILVLAVNVASLPMYPLWSLAKPGFYRQTGSEATGYEVVGLIPPTASVVAQDGIIPHLSHREKVFLLKDDAPEADYVVACENISPWPYEEYEAIEQYLAGRVEEGYTTIYSDNGWVLLERPPGDQSAV